MLLTSFLPVVLLACVVEAAPFEGVRSMFEKRGHEGSRGNENWKAAHGGGMVSVGNERDRGRGMGKGKGKDPMPAIGTPGQFMSSKHGGSEGALSS